MTLLLPACNGTDLEKIQYLKVPRITLKPDAHAITVRLKGTPGEISASGFGILYKVNYKLDEKYRKKLEAPRARWEALSANAGKDMTATFALIVDVFLLELPKSVQEEFPDVKLVDWGYGEVGEILHVGPYNAEKSSVEKLSDFIKTNGYTISGLHEEEYYKGPGMFFKGNENNYHTIIRYQVRKQKN
mgnify:CR=1 FL=1